MYKAYSGFLYFKYISCIYTLGKVHDFVLFRIHAKKFELVKSMLIAYLRHHTLAKQNINTSNTTDHAIVWPKFEMYQIYYKSMPIPQNIVLPNQVIFTVGIQILHLYFSRPVAPEI